MNQESSLCFVWIGKYRCFTNAGINLSSKYKFRICNINKQDDLPDKEPIVKLRYDFQEYSTENFYKENVSLAAIVGSNGAGKTSLLKFIQNLCNGSGTGDDAVSQFIVVYERSDSNSTWLEAYYKGINLKCRGMIKKNLKYWSEISTNRKTELPADIEYIYFAHTLEPAGIQWHMMHDVSTGNVLTLKNESIMDSIISGIRALEKEARKSENSCTASEKIEAFLNDFKSLFYEYYRRSTLAEYRSNENEKIISFLSHDSVIAKKYNLKIESVRAMLKDNYYWREDEKFKKKEREIDLFLPRTKIIDVESFQCALARALFFSFLSSMIEHVVPDGNKRLKNEVIRLICHDSIFEKSTGIQRLKAFFEYLKEYYHTINTIHSGVIDNYLSFLEYAEKKEIYENGTKFEQYQEKRFFTLSINNQSAAKSDIADYREWERQYEQIVSMYSVFDYDLGLSEGERAVLTIFSRIYAVASKVDANNVVILIDEAETSLHPEWQRSFVDSILDLQEFFPRKNIQIIIATHSPLILSDMLNTHTVFLEKDGDITKVVPSSEKKQTFASNIYRLYDDAFFLRSSTGKFSDRWLQKLLQKIEENPHDPDTREEINLIGDSFLKRLFEKNYEDILIKENGIARDTKTE